MKTIKIKLHSSVDLITNSSTVIFTYSEGSVEKLKELVNEMLKTFSQSLTFDDMFQCDVFLDDNYNYCECENETVQEAFKGVEDNDKFINETKIKIIKGEIERPGWMKIAEEEESWSGYNKSTTLEIIPRDEKYSELANKLLKYLYSTSHEATMGG